MPPESPQITDKGEALISPERKKQIRADLTRFQLFAFQGPRITTGDGKWPLSQLNETDVKYEFSGYKKQDEWENIAVAMTDHGLLGGQRISNSLVSRLYPLVEPVFPIGQNILKEKKGLIALETMLDDGRLSVLMAGYANYERFRGNCPTPTGFELVFSNLAAVNRFFGSLEKNPMATINEYVSAAIGGVDGGRHAAFGGKWPSAIGYLGVRRYNDEMFQAEVTNQNVRVIKHYKNIEELAEENEKSEARKPASPGRQKVDSAGVPMSNEPPAPPGHYRGESKIVTPRRPGGYFSLVEKYGSLSYDGLSMETQHNAPPAEAPKPELTPVVENKRFIFDSSAATDVGKVRDHNEDVVRINEGGLRNYGVEGLYIVADGMGGHGAGETASAIAADVIAQQFARQEFPRQIQTLDHLPPEKRQEYQLALQEKQKKWLLAAVGQTNHAVFERRKNSTDTAERDMGTTLVMAVRFGDQVMVANVGDSRAYMVSADGKTLTQITRDHSLVASLVAANLITAEEAKVHPRRSEIYRTIGYEPRVEADVFFAKIPQGGAMLLCSDGLTGMVNDLEILKIVSASFSSQEAVKRLIAAANAAGGKDNISAIVVRNGSETAPVDEKASVDRVIKDIAAEIGGGSPDRQKLTRLITELLSGAVALAADREKLNKTMAFVLKVAQKYKLDFG